MAIDEKRAADQILAAVHEVHKDRGVRGMPDDFCKIWPQAKPILEFLAGIAIFIPGMGTVAGGVLKGLITIGDQISKQVCHT